MVIRAQSNDHSAHLADVSPKRFFTDALTFARVQLLVTEYYRVDATLLKEGPVESIVERIRLYIDKMARDGRCMIHFNQIPAETPPEHIHAAVAACHTYGRHPIPENLDDVSFEIPKRESFADFMRAKGEPLST